MDVLINLVLIGALAVSFLVSLAIPVVMIGLIVWMVIIVFRDAYNL